MNQDDIAINADQVNVWNESNNVLTYTGSLKATTALEAPALNLTQVTPGSETDAVLVISGNTVKKVDRSQFDSDTSWQPQDTGIGYTGPVIVSGALRTTSAQITSLSDGSSYPNLVMADASGNLGIEALTDLNLSPWSEGTGNTLEYTSGSIRTQGMISEASTDATPVFTGKSGGVTQFEVLANGDLTADAMVAHADNDGHKAFLVKNASNEEIYRIYGDGKVEAQEVLVDLSIWPDYVFEDTYELRPLEEVKEYVEENNHLPEVPSEKEIVENGLNLGEMDAIMMKKIEELTLYIIEQNKRIEEQNKNLLDQNTRIEELERKLEEK